MRDFCRALGKARADRKHGNEVGYLRRVYFYRAHRRVLNGDFSAVLTDFRAEFAQQSRDFTVALRGIDVGVVDGNFSADRACDEKKRRLRPVAVGDVVGGDVVLLSSYVPALVGHIDLDAELRHRADSHIDVARALDRRGEDDVAVAVEQRQSKQQSRDELRADVAGHAENSAFQLAADRKRKSAVGGAGHSLFGKQLGVNPDRPLGKPAGSDKGRLGASCGGNGNEEPQSAAAFAAVEHSGFVFKHFGAVDGQNAAVDFGFCAQSLNALNCRLDVVRQRNWGNGAFAP